MLLFESASYMLHAIGETLMAEEFAEDGSGWITLWVQGKTRVNQRLRL